MHFRYTAKSFVIEQMACNTIIKTIRRNKMEQKHDRVGTDDAYNPGLDFPKAISGMQALGQSSIPIILGCIAAMLIIVFFLAPIIKKLF